MATKTMKGSLILYHFVLRLMSDERHIPMPEGKGAPSFLFLNIRIRTSHCSTLCKIRCRRLEHTNAEAKRILDTKVLVMAKLEPRTLLANYLLDEDGLVGCEDVAYNVPPHKPHEFPATHQETHQGVQQWRTPPQHTAQGTQIPIRCA
jgi:hypothetical protein